MLRSIGIAEEADITRAFLDMRDIVATRRVTPLDIQSLGSALGAIGLEQYVDDLDDVLMIGVHDVNELWERVVDALLDKVLMELATNAVSHARYYYAESLLERQAELAKADGASRADFERLIEILRDIEQGNLDLASFRVELADARLQRTKRLMRIHMAETGSIPLSFFGRLSFQQVDMARAIGATNGR